MSYLIFYILTQIKINSDEMIKFYFPIRLGIIQADLFEYYYVKMRN